MKMLIIGASRGTGASAVRVAMGRGHEVTAFARNPKKLLLEDPKLMRLPGDFHDEAAVDGAVNGKDAVIITASAATLKGFRENPTYFSQGTAYVIAAMQRHKVRRLVVLSALGVGESRDRMGFVVNKLIVGWLLRRPFEDHERQEALVQKSGLDWVIARPSRLTDGPARGQYVRKTTPGPVPNSISRADTAAFLVEAAEVDAWVGRAVQLGG